MNILMFFKIDFNEVSERLSQFADGVGLTDLTCAPYQKRLPLLYEVGMETLVRKVL
jgi:hypothetical protein